MSMGVVDWMLKRLPFRFERCVGCGHLFEHAVLVGIERDGVWLGSCFECYHRAGMASLNGVHHEIMDKYDGAFKKLAKE